MRKENKQQKIVHFIVLYSLNLKTVEKKQISQIACSLSNKKFSDPD